MFASSRSQQSIIIDRQRQVRRDSDSIVFTDPGV